MKTRISKVGLPQSGPLGPAHTQSLGSKAEGRREGGHGLAGRGSDLCHPPALEPRAAPTAWCPLLGHWHLTADSCHSLTCYLQGPVLKSERKQDQRL